MVMSSNNGNSIVLTNIFMHEVALLRFCLCCFRRVVLVLVLGLL